jgi:hypothetical protein
MEACLGAVKPDTPFSWYSETSLQPFFFTKAMETLRTLSYIVLVVATFTATYVVAQL